MVILGERHLRRAIAEYVEHYHLERTHQGLGNRLIEGVPERESGHSWIFFRFDRRLLAELPRLASQTVLEVYRAVLDRQDVTPGMIAAIHTFGELVHWHPHLHALVTDGAFVPDATFIALPALDDEPFERLWQRKVFDLLLKHGKTDQSLVTQIFAPDDVLKPLAQPKRDKRLASVRLGLGSSGWLVLMMNRLQLF